jgi:hypothetical protein
MNVLRLEFIILEHLATKVRAFLMVIQCGREFESIGFLLFFFFFNMFGLVYKYRMGLNEILFIFS